MSRDELGTACLLAVAKRYVESVAKGVLSVSEREGDGRFSLLLFSVIEFIDSGTRQK